jgi:hypothetical protein
VDKRWVVLTGSLALVVSACGGGGGGSSSGPNSDFCALATTVDEESGRLLEGADAGALERRLKDLIDTAKDAVSDAPSEIKDDLEVSVEGFERFRDVLADADYDLEAVDDAAMSDLVADDELTAVNERVEQYLEEQCGLEEDSDSAPASEDTTASQDTQAPDDTTADSGSDTGAAATATDAQVALLRSVLTKLSEDDARCLLENSGTAGQSVPDLTALASALSGCGLDPSDLVSG